MTYKEHARRYLIGSAVTVQRFMEMELQPSEVNESGVYMRRVMVELPTSDRIGVWLSVALGEDGKYRAGRYVLIDSCHTVTPVSRNSTAYDNKTSLMVATIADIRTKFPEIPGSSLDDAMNELFDTVHKQMTLDL